MTFIDEGVRWGLLLTYRTMDPHRKILATPQVRPLPVVPPLVLLGAAAAAAAAAGAGATDAAGAGGGAAAAAAAVSAVVLLVWCCWCCWCCWCWVLLGPCCFG